MTSFGQRISLIKTLLLAALLLVCVNVNAQDDPVKTTKNDKIKVEVFPNPTSDYLTVDLSKLSLISPKIEIRNIIGSQMRMDIEKLEDKKHRVDVKDYPPGYYLVLVRDVRSKFQQTIRFSKK